MPPGQQAAEQLVLLDGHCTHQHGLALFVAVLDLGDNRPVLARLRLIHDVVVVLALVGTVGGNLHNVQLVDGAELLLLRHGGTGHTGQLVIQTEVVLESDGGQGLVLAGHGHVLLGLDGLVQAVGIPPAEHQTAGVLVHDDNLAVLHDIVDVPLHHAVGLDGLVDVVGEGSVLRVGQIVHVEELLRLGDAPGGQHGGAGLLIDDVIRVRLGGILFLLVVHLDDRLLLHAGDQHLCHVIQLGGLLRPGRR